MQYGKFALIYDRLMSDVDYDAWAAYVCGFMPQGCSVFECACGTGEITRRVASAGHIVTATDISEDMLGVASEKLRRMGAVSHNVRFARMDMRAITSHKPVDCVLCCCDGVNYLLSRDDVKRFFKAAYDILKPDGMLLFDVSSGYKLKNLIGNSCFADRSDDAPYMWQNTYDEQSNLIEMELSFFVKCGELYARFDEKHIQRAHSLNELTTWLEQCGFEVKAFEFGTDNAPDDETERIQFTARKI